jgi:mannose-1-phosphate guanylyltransferase
MKMKQAGIRDIIINLHYLPDDIIRFFAAHDNFGLNITFSCEPVILGTGGGLKKCEKLLHDDDFIIMNSDVIADIDLNALAAHHRVAEVPATIALFKTERAASIGPVALCDNHVIDFKNFLGSGISSEYIYTGTALCSPVIFRFLREEFSSIVYTGYTGIIGDSRLGAYVHRGYWHDIGTAESYLGANLALLDEQDAVAREARIMPGLDVQAVARGVDTGTAVIEHSVIGAGSRIGDGAVIRNSVLLPGSVAAPKSVIENSVMFLREIIGS